MDWLTPSVPTSTIFTFTSKPSRHQNLGHSSKTLYYVHLKGHHIIMLERVALIAKHKPTLLLFSRLQFNQLQASSLRGSYSVAKLPLPQQNIRRKLVH